MTKDTAQQINPLFDRIIAYHQAVDGSVITDHATHQLGHWRITITGKKPSIDQRPFTALVASDQYVGVMSISPRDVLTLGVDMAQRLLEDLDAALQEESTA